MNSNADVDPNRLTGESTCWNQTQLSILHYGPTNKWAWPIFETETKAIDSFSQKLKLHINTQPTKHLTNQPTK